MAAKILLVEFDFEPERISIIHILDDKNRNFKSYISHHIKWDAIINCKDLSGDSTHVHARTHNLMWWVVGGFI